MKEASGELSMTAIAVVAIAALGVLFTTLIYPSIKKSLLHSQACSAAGSCTPNTDGTATCYSYETGDTCKGAGGEVVEGRCKLTCDDIKGNTGTGTGGV